MLSDTAPCHRSSKGYYKSNYRKFMCDWMISKPCTLDAKKRLSSESTRGWERAYVRYQLDQGADRGMSGDLPFNNVAGVPPAEGLNIEMGNSIGSGCLEEISYLSKTSTEASKF